MHLIGRAIGLRFSNRRFGAIASENRKLARSVRNHTMHRMGTRNKHTRKTAAGQAQGLRVPSRKTETETEAETETETDTETEEQGGLLSGDISPRLTSGSRRRIPRVNGYASRTRRTR